MTALVKGSVARGSAPPPSPVKHRYTTVVYLCVKYARGGAESFMVEVSLVISLS